MVELIRLMILASPVGCSDQADFDQQFKKQVGRGQGQVIAPLENASLYIYKKGMDLYGPAFAVSDETDRDGHFAI